MKFPRSFLVVLCASVAPLATGCVVPQNRYDDAVSRLDAERTAHQADRAELERDKAELATLNAALGTREKSLAVREGELAEAKLAGDRVSTERDDAVQLVEQLRGELGRVGDDLREFSDQKKTLEAALSEAEDRQKKLEHGEKLLEKKVLLVRDLTLALGESIEAGKASVTVIDGKPAVRLDASDVFGSEKELASSARGRLVRLASVFEKRTDARLELGDRSSDAVTPEDRIVRLQKIADVLTERGIGFERIGFAVSPPVETSTAETEPAQAKAKTETAEGAKAAPSPSTSFRDGPGSVEVVIDVDTPS
jgi:hypothetical protein